MALIPHQVENRIVQQRAHDGYINATEMCRAAGKLFGNYNQNKTTEEFLAALSSDIGIPISLLVQAVRGGPLEARGTWVHPQVAVHLAQWLSPQFAVQVSKWVYEWMSGKIVREAIPKHIRRYLINRHKIPPTHFSMLDQMTLRLLAPLETHSYLLPDRLMPDIALGLMFSRWLRENGYDPDSFPAYEHEFPPGDRRPVVLARLYPNALMTEFNQQLDEWLRDGRARRYFGERDPDAILPLDRVLATLPPPIELTSNPGSIAGEEDPQPDPRIPPHKNPGTGGHKGSKGK